MAKFNISSAVPGQVGDIQRAVAAEAEHEAASQPTQPAQAETLDSLLSAPETAAIVEEGVTAGIEQEAAPEVQRERERVQPIPERYADRERVDFYDFDKSKEEEARLIAAKQASEGKSADGGLADRANHFATVFANNPKAATGFNPSQTSAARDIMVAMNALDQETRMPSYNFLKVMSVVTENTIADIAFNEGLSGVEPDRDDAGNIVETPAMKKKGTEPVAKLQGAKALGTQINREWQRMNNAAQGLPTDQYTDLTPEQALQLGDMAKELYYEANKTFPGAQFMTRGKTENGQVAFALTKHGADEIAAGAAKRKRLFPKQHVRPSKTPLPGGRFVGEAKTYTKRVSGKVGKKPAGGQVINEAMKNLNTVPNVVDTQRLKILLVTALPVLRGETTPEDLGAIVNHVGKKQMNKFNAKAAKDPKFNAEANYQELLYDLAQSLFGIANERNGANYLTYYMQAFNGRIAPQQTHFDPTSSKTVRFVTRNAVPAKATPGSRIEKNLRQMYAMMLVKDADVLLPKAREFKLEAESEKLAAWGRQLRDAVNGITDQQVDDVMEAIKAGTPVTDPNFPTLPAVELQDKELEQAIKSKGEDGQAFMDGLIDFANYYEAKQAGRPHHSYFNAYMDGKTNGLASNGIQMGSEQVAYKTGVLRSQNRDLLDNNQDIRDSLAEMLTASLDQGFDGATGKFANELHAIATELFNVRELNKATTMTFGYGMELNSFKNTIDEHLGELEQSNPAVAASMASATQDASRQDVIDALHGKYIEGLAQALDENALKSRALMRSAAMMHALTNELFSIESATGLELNLGGTSLQEWEQVGKYKVDGREVRFGDAERVDTAAAAKRRKDEETDEITLEPGGIAYGGAVPAPVQSLDAATVAMTASGRSWDRLKMASGGNPYMHTIYDAFKVDAMGYDVVLDEVNKNWLNAGMDWSYLEETRNAMDSLREKWAEKNANRPANSPLSKDEWAVAGHLLEPVQAASGRMWLGNLKNKLEKLIEAPNSEAASELAYDMAKKIEKEMGNRGFNVNNPPAQPTYKNLKDFIELFAQAVDLNPRLNRMINETNNNKKKLRSKIKADGLPVYQYYSH